VTSRGVSGIVKGRQTDRGEPMFEEAPRLYPEEITAAVRGAKAAGEVEIVVMGLLEVWGLGRS
jgi:D-amino peptidase